LWYRCFASFDQVRIYRAHDGNKVLGFLPLSIKNIKRIRFLTSLTNDHCFQSIFLIRPGYEEQFTELILEELLKDRDGWDAIRFNFSYTFNKLPDLFPKKMISNAGLSHEMRIKPTYVVLLSNSFSEYFQKDLKPKVRKNIKMYQKRLEKAGSVSFVHFSGYDAINMWPEFIRIEDSGWKGNCGTSIKRLGLRFNLFYEGLISILAKYGALNLFFLEVNGKYIAGVFGYTDGDTFHYAKIGYDVQFKSLSPSNLLFMHLVKYMFTNFPNIKRIHMFPWDHGYKHRYATENESCFDILIYNKSFCGNAIHLLSKTKKSIKRILKPVII